MLGLRISDGGPRAALQRVVEFAVHDQGRALIGRQAAGEIGHGQRAKTWAIDSASSAAPRSTKPSSR